MNDRTPRMSTAEYRKAKLPDDAKARVEKVAGDARRKTGLRGVSTARQALDLAISEAELQATVEDFLTTHGWLWFHDRAVNRPGAHLNNPGFPDIVAVHPSGAGPVFLELKREKNSLSPEQEAWREALRAAGAKYAVVRPSSWDRVAKHLVDMLRR